MLQVTFPEIARVLESAGSSVSAAEGHGCLCGALCTTDEYSLQRWLEELIPENAGALEELDQPGLQLLFNDTLQALRGDEMQFEPLVPDDAMTLETRATALSQWCQGFLYGFGIGQPIRLEQLSPDVGEVLKDLTHISRASVDIGESGEDEEQAYSEVIEYLRVGVQLIHDELAPVRESKGVPPVH